MSDALVVATLKKLAAKIQKFDKQQFITNIFYKDSALEVEFRNGFKQRFVLDVPAILNDNVNEELIKRIDILDKKVKRQNLSKKLKTELENIKQSLTKKLEERLQDIANFPTVTAIREEEVVKGLEEKLLTILQDQVQKEFSRLEIPVPKDGKDGRDGQDSKDIDVEALTKELQQYILTNIPSVRDGIDGRDGRDAEAIPLDVIKEELQEYIIANIPDVKDGKDGKDADQQQITATLEEKLKQLVTDDYDKLQIFIKDLIGVSRKELKESLSSYKQEERVKIKSLINNLSTSYKEELQGYVQNLINQGFAKLPKAKDGRDGADGRDGRDADVDAIITSVNQKVAMLVDKTAEALQEQVNSAVTELIEVAKKAKGTKGDKGDSIKGDNGNGIKSAEIDQLGDLIITTDERIINAGRVGIKNFYGGGGGSNPFYTNSKPIPFDVGQIKAGTRFKDADLRVVFTKLFYGFDFPEFNTFFIQNANNIDIGGIFEIGYLVPIGDYLFNFNIINPELLEENSIFIEQDGQLLADKLDNTSPITIPLNEFTKDMAGAVTFKILAYDTTGVTFQKDYICEYRYKIYYGEYTDDITDWILDGNTNPLSILRASELADDIYGEYYFQSVGYKWFCYPESLGEKYVFYDISSDIALVFNEVKKIEITNQYGLTIIYNCYRTLNEIHDEFVMGVKNG
jgi:hypothetical protein